MAMEYPCPPQLFESVVAILSLPSPPHSFDEFDPFSMVPLKIEYLSNRSQNAGKVWKYYL